MNINKKAFIILSIDDKIKEELNDSYHVHFDESFFDSLMKGDFEDKPKDKTKDIKSMLYIKINQLMKWLNHRIGAETIIEYRTNSVNNLECCYEVKRYTNEDKNKQYSKLILEKLNIVKKFLENLPETLFEKKMLFRLRSINILLKKCFNTDIKNIFVLSLKYNDKIIYKKNIVINFPKIKNVEYVVTELCDGSTIRQYIDPYINNYGVFVDYSKPVDELNYMYNCLHVYEHYVTYAWKNLSNNNVIDLNGATFSNGLCFVYTISKTKETLMERLVSSILFHIKSSNIDFIEKTKGLDIETTRTISETYMLRNLSRLGRSDQQAYNKGYNKDIFAYWSSQPMNILVVTSEKLDINVDEFNKFYNKYHVNVKQPKMLDLIYFPKEISIIHYKTGSHMFKKNIDKIIKKVYDPTSETKSFYGIGNRLVNLEDEEHYINKIIKKKNKTNINKLIKTKLDKVDCSMYQTLLHSLLFFAKYTTKETVQNYINNSLVPPDVMAFDNFPAKTLGTTALQFMENDDDECY